MPAAAAYNSFLNSLGRVLALFLTMADKTISIRTDTTSRITLSLTDIHLKVQKPTSESRPVSYSSTTNCFEGSNPTAHHNIPHRNILKATLEDGSHTLRIAYLEKKKRKPMHQVVVEGTVEEAERTRAAEWVETVMAAAYESTCVM